MRITVDECDSPKCSNIGRQTVEGAGGPSGWIRVQISAIGAKAKKGANKIACSAACAQEVAQADIKALGGSTPAPATAAEAAAQ